MTLLMENDETLNMEYSQRIPSWEAGTSCCVLKATNRCRYKEDKLLQ